MKSSLKLIICTISWEVTSNKGEEGLWQELCQTGNSSKLESKLNSQKEYKNFICDHMKSNLSIIKWVSPQAFISRPSVWSATANKTALKATEEIHWQVSSFSVWCCGWQVKGSTVIRTHLKNASKAPWRCYGSAQNAHILTCMLETTTFEPNRVLPWTLWSTSLRWVQKSCSNMLIWSFE
jgi:hypothetical protein